MHRKMVVFSETYTDAVKDLRRWRNKNQDLVNIEDVKMQNHRCGENNDFLTIIVIYTLLSK